MHIGTATACYCCGCRCMGTAYRDIPDAGSHTVVKIHKCELWQSQGISAAIYWPCQTKIQNLIRSQESNIWVICHTLLLAYTSPARKEQFQMLLNRGVTTCCETYC